MLPVLFSMSIPPQSTVSASVDDSAPTADDTTAGGGGIASTVAHTVLSGAKTVADLTAIPGLAPAVKIVDHILVLCENVSKNKSVSGVVSDMK